MNNIWHGPIGRLDEAIEYLRGSSSVPAGIGASWLVKEIEKKRAGSRYDAEVDSYETAWTTIKDACSPFKKAYIILEQDIGEFRCDALLIVRQHNRRGIQVKIGIFECKYKTPRQARPQQPLDYFGILTGKLGNRMIRDQQIFVHKPFMLLTAPNDYRNAVDAGFVRVTPPEYLSDSHNTWSNYFSPAYDLAENEVAQVIQLIEER